MRARAVSPDKLIDDFLFVTTPRSIHTQRLPGGDISDTYRRAYRQQKFERYAKARQPGRTLRAARSVVALHAAFTR